MVSHRSTFNPFMSWNLSQVSPGIAKGMNKAATKVFGMLGTAQYDMKGVNGWLIPMNVGRFGTDYETRAFMAYAGLDALTSDDCLYPTTFVDSKGRWLDAGSKYVIHFEKDKLPPSHSGVWSISAYRENFYVHNPIERYGILSSMPLKYNADGSLDIFIKRDSPGKGKNRTGYRLLPVFRSTCPCVFTSRRRKSWTDARRRM